jgi:hypothetical protein
MTQTTQVAPTRREIVKQELATLAFITRGGNWLFLLLSRLAEPLMFLSVLYVIAETVLPSLFKAHMLLGISSACIIVLNTAPEVILPGCFMQASMAEEDQAWMYKTMGSVFIGLTFITLASFIWEFPAGAVSVILFFRCAAGVLYSLLVRMTPQCDLHMSNRQHQTQLDELAKRFNQQVQQLEKSFQQRLNESSTTLERSFHQHLVTELSPVQESFQQHQEMLALTPGMKAHFQHIEGSIAEDLRQIKASLERQAHSQVTEPKILVDHPVLRALPSVQPPNSDVKTRSARDARQSHPQAVSGEKFDARAFVFACLQENADLKLSEIEHLALTRDQELSQPTISRYRKLFFASRESSTVVNNESSTMKAESVDESSLGESESIAVGQ